jgi:hypothetical protein
MAIAWWRGELLVVEPHRLDRRAVEVEHDRFARIVVVGELEAHPDLAAHQGIAGFDAQAHVVLDVADRRGPRGGQGARDAWAGILGGERHGEAERQGLSAACGRNQGCVVAAAPTRRGRRR